MLNSPLAREEQTPDKISRDLKIKTFYEKLKSPLVTKEIFIFW